MRHWFMALVVVGALVVSLGCALLGARETPEEVAVVDATATPQIQATATTAPTVAESPDPVSGGLLRSEAGGFAFRAIPGYVTEMDEATVVMLAPSANENGPALMLLGGDFWEGVTAEELLEVFADDADVETDAPTALTAVGAAGVSAEQHGDGIRGRVVVLMPTATQGLVMMARAPEARWSELEPLLNGVIESLEFFAPVAGTEEGGSLGDGLPTVLGASSGWTIFSDANEVRGLVAHDGVLYAAGLGGVVAWDVAAGTGVKSTTLDGMGQISVRDAVYCEVPLSPGATPRPAVVVGTGEGLSAYDLTVGRWSRLDPGLEGFPVKSRVPRLFCDAAHQRLMMSSDGLGIWDFGNGTWRRITTRDGMLWNEARGIAVRGNEIWVGSGYNGVSVLTDGEVTATHSEDDGLPSNRVHAVLLDRDGQTLWMGTGKGIVKLSGAQWTLYSPDEVEGMPRGSLTYVVQADDGTLWVGSETGTVCHFDPTTTACVVTYKAETRNPFVAALTLDHEGNVYFSDGRTGVHALRGESWQMLAYPGEVLASNFVDAIAEDASGMLWVGTNGGLQRLDPADTDAPWQVFVTADGTGGGRARSISLAPDGTLWFAMVNGDATRYADGDWSTREGLRNTNVVAVDVQGRAWFGSNDGITIWDGVDVTTLGEADGLPSARVNALLLDGDAMWIGTGAGVARWEGNVIEVVLSKEVPALNGGYVQALGLLDDGTLLVGTMGAMARYDGAEAVRLTGAGAGVRSIAVSLQGEIWAAGYDGLITSDDGGETWTAQTSADGLPSSFINAVFIDRFGSVWISSGGDGAGGGLARYVP